MMDTEASLWECCRKGDQEAREQLIRRYLEWVEELVKGYANLFHWMPGDDLYRIARTGLIQAVDNFDPARDDPDEKIDLRFKRHASGIIESEIWKHCRQKTHEPLILHYYKWAMDQAKIYAPRLHWVFQEDLNQLAAEGLIKAVDKFDPVKGNPNIELEGRFKNYASKIIKSRIFSSPEVLRIPRRLYKICRKVIKAQDELMRKLGRRPTIAEIAKEAGLTEKQVEDALNVIAIGFPGPLPEDGLEKAIEDGLEKAIEDGLEKAIEDLPEREQKIIALTYWEGLKDSEIAAWLNIEPNNVKQIRLRAHRHLFEYIFVERMLSEHKEEMERALEDLPEREREVIILHHRRARKDSDIAKESGIKPNKVKQIRLQARRHLFEYCVAEHMLRPLEGAGLRSDEREKTLMKRALEGLPEREREVIILTQQGLKDSDIAKRLDIEPNKVKEIRLQAHRRLFATLSKLLGLQYLYRI